MFLEKKLQELNFQNLISVSSLIRNIEHFICYGTLLGIIRDKNIIKGDDDVDFMVNFKSKKLLLKKMKLNKKFKMNKKVSNDYFAQFIKKDETLKTFVDFYFYIEDSKKNYIIEKHNWLGMIRDKRLAIHFPKKIIFPIIKGKRFNMPNKSKAVCKFLYGTTWSKPLKKNINYRTEVVNNKPLMIKRSYLGSLTRKFKNILNINNYKKII